MYENNVEDIKEAQNGNEEKMTKLINDNAGLIWNIVKRFNYRGYELDDLYQIGAMGFIKSIKRFDTDFEVKLSTYAVPYILGEIKRYIRDDGPIKVSRSIKELAIKIQEIQRQYFYKNGKEINVNQIAEKLKISKEEVAVAIESSKPIESIDQEKNSDNDTRGLIEKISNNKDEADLIINKLSIKELIEKLPDREKKVILLRYYKEKTQSQVAKILGISQVQVSRIEKRILNSMKLKLIG